MPIYEYRCGHCGARVEVGEIVGDEGASPRIDVLGIALHKGMTVEELSRLDLAYVPPIAPVWDPLNGLDSMVSPHFGRCPHYILVDVDGHEVRAVNAVDNPYHG